MREHINNCPKCGSKEIVVCTWLENHKKVGQVTCLNCKTESSVVDYERIIQTWNKDSESKKRKISCKHEDVRYIHKECFCPDKFPYTETICNDCNRIIDTTFYA